ncbi:MAG: hypothetical protein H0V81_16835 [Solirubrobacterales bacterium]|nr:hypothetical protein [Solirubrobacterales bacterium]
MTQRARFALLGLVAGLLVGCGGTSDLDRVRGYFEDVDAVYRSADPQFRAADDTFRKFAGGGLKGKVAEFELRRAELDIEQVRQQVAALVPPVQAGRLHELVIRAYELNVLMAAETRQLAAFVPRADSIVKRVDKARRKLRKELGAAGGLERQSRALRTYARRVTRLRSELAALQAPPALAAARRTQLDVMSSTRKLTLQLVRAIGRQDKPTIERLLNRFASAGDPNPDRARWQKGGIAAYRQRIVDIDRAAADVTAERARVIQAVG